MSEQTDKSLKLVKEETQALLRWATKVEELHQVYYERGQILARRLGAHYREDGLTEIGFWTPELASEILRPREIYLEVFTPIEEFDFKQPTQTLKFRRDRLRLIQQGEYFWGVIEGMIPGTRNQLGSFYWLKYFDQLGQLGVIRDPLAYSFPFGVFAPAELYDLASLQQHRGDLEYFRRTGVPLSEQEIPRVEAPNNILQLHLGTASPEGTIGGLTRIYQQIAAKIEQGLPLTSSESNYVDYDALQLLPVEPTIEYRENYSINSHFFNIDAPEEDIETIFTSLPSVTDVPIQLIKPNTQGWGYDVPILGSSSINPAILTTLRLEEFVDLVVTLHNFPTGPIQVILDLVYGHADNQSELLISRQFLKGPNMYGQDLNHQLPNVRAMLLEMQRRKINLGADGIRVDGGQDFRFFNPLSGRVEYDDGYLLAMSDLVQEVGEYQRLLFTIFEDGRPWPAEGWEEISTYRELIELKPESYQWGPLVFAHNTPTLEGFWLKKWRRVCEVMYQGENWITGCGNHDTVRRGNQIDPRQNINWKLGKTLPEVLNTAYDNPAVMLWVYGFSPGLPMDFINATCHAPWMFFRNTDDRYGVKVVSEEVGFLHWQVTSEIYDQPENFTRLKAIGFETLAELRECCDALQVSMMETNYNLPEVIKAVGLCTGEDTDSCTIPALKNLNRPEMVKFLANLDIPRLNGFALRFMEDCYEVCNVGHYYDKLDPQQTAFNLKLRQFRHQHPWLRHNLTESDRFDKLSDQEKTIYFGLRTHPDNPQIAVAMIAHMEGETTSVKLTELFGWQLEEWEVAIASPELANSQRLQDLSSIELANSEAVLLVKKVQS